MKALKISRRVAPAVLAAAVTLAAAPAALAHTRAHLRGGWQHSPAGAVYTETNATTGNALQVFYRGRNGALSAGGSYATGGAGTGSGLGSGHSVIASSSGKVVLAVNAGSNTVSAFEVRRQGGLHQLGQAVPSGGTTPTSVTISVPAGAIGLGAH